MIGAEIHEFAKELWPINRSITGPGVRETLKKIKTHLPNLSIKSIPTGTKVFDWSIPREWKVNEAYIIAPNGEKICDFSTNNLHLLGYSSPFEGRLTLNELKEYLHTLPDQPNAIPYVTSYYQERWGFCLTHEQYKKLTDGLYYVRVDTDLFDGALNFGELLIKGKKDKEILLSTYICHPSMANNEISGPAVLTFLAKWVTQQKKSEYSYRFIFVPETIGSIAYLSFNYEEMKSKVFAGFNVSCVGDNRSYSFLPSRTGDTLSDQVGRHVLTWIDTNYKSYSWLDRGSDERQYCAPGIDLPVASIMRTKFGQYPEYHTSLDDLINVVTPKGLDGGYWALHRAIEAIEKNKKYKVTVLCEPQMGRRGLYPTLSTKKSTEQVKLMMDFISLCDGESFLLEIADRLAVPIWELYELVNQLEKQDLIKVLK